MVHLSENEGIEGRIFVVTGGAGFVGRALCLELVRRGAAQVRSLDKTTSEAHLSQLKKHGVICISGDIRRKEDVEKAFKTANGVFHLASFGMSGKEMLQVRQIDDVNLDGTLNVLDSCVSCGVTRLVYTSTYNVVFGGQEIRNGNEAMEYFPLENHVDPYGRSKALAEQLVLKSNNRAHKNGKGGKLYTCALRPAAIYGPGEERHLPRILRMAEAGLLLFRIGGLDTKQDWVYVDNLVQAQLLASMALLDDVPDRGLRAPAAGQTYFISDGAPINTSKFLTPLVEALGYKYADREISWKSAMNVAWVFWALYGLLYPYLQKSWLPQPLILPAEVYKVAITHYFSILKARQELSYVPLVDPKDGMSRTVAHFKAKQEKEVPSPNFFVFAFILFGLFANFVSAVVPLQLQGPFKLTTTLGLCVFRSIGGIRIVFALAFLAHVLEGFYAWRLALKVDALNANKWFWQTFLLGFPSLKLLLRRAESRREAKEL